MKTLNNYSFVKKYLFHKGNKLFINGKQILEYKAGIDNSKIKDLITEIPIGQDFIELEDDNIIVITYHQLNEMGYVLSKTALTKEKAWRMSQKYVYTIRKSAKTLSGEKSLPKNVKILYDQKNKRLRAVGPCCGSDITRKDVGDWVNIKESTRRQKEFTPDQILDEVFESDPRYSLIDDIQADYLGELSSRIPKVFIKDVPFMISNENEIVCIDNRPDMRTIGIVGDRGTGKSQCLVKLMDEIFYKFKDDWVCMLNDSLSQFHELAKPMENHRFIMKLKLIGEEPIPLPVVNLYVGSENVEILNKDEGVGFIYTISPDDFYDNYEYFTDGIDGAELGKPIRYLPILKEYIRDCKDGESVAQKIENNWEELNLKKSDGMQNMIFRWRGSIGKMLNYKFISNVYDDEMISPVWKVQTKDGIYEGDPLICCLRARIIPLLNTHASKTNQQVSRNIVASLMKKILDHQRQRKYGTHRIWVFVDELSDMYEKGAGKKIDNLTKEFLTTFKQGRTQRIGFVYNTQSFKDLPRNIIQNTKTIISTQIAHSEEERTAIQKSFGLDKAEKDQLSKLDPLKKEIIAVQESPFIVYDTDGNRKVGRKFYRGWLIPPNSNTIKLGV